MLVFLDFEASSLGKQGFPIEVAWVFEDGASEAHLIRPAPGWQEWDSSAEAIHRIPRATLDAEGAPHDHVAERMIAQLGGHDLLASAPSWDGKWLSALLRAAGVPRHSLRLRDSDEARRELARELLADSVPAAELAAAAETLVARLDREARTKPPQHRALADAEEDRRRWIAVRDAAGAGGR